MFRLIAKHKNQFLLNKIYSSSSFLFPPSTFNRQDDYEICNFLGKGSSARVFQGFNVINDEKIVIKMFKKYPEEAIREQISINKHLLANLPKNNPHIHFIKLLDVLMNSGCGSYTLIYQFWPGVTLSQLIPVIKMPRVINIMKKLLHTIQYIHRQGVVHRDIKPSNILITEEGVKLFDFGLAKNIGKDQKLKGKNFGTKCYKTPEVIYRYQTYNESVDIWALGLVFAEMILNKKHLLNHDSDISMLSKMASFCKLEEPDTKLIDQRLLEEIRINKSKSWEQIASKCQVDKALISLIKSMIEINPQKRARIEKILQHPIFKQ